MDVASVRPVTHPRAAVAMCVALPTNLWAMQWTKAPGIAACPSGFVWPGPFRRVTRRSASAKTADPADSGSLWPKPRSSAQSQVTLTPKRASGTAETAAAVGSGGGSNLGPSSGPFDPPQPIVRAPLSPCAGRRLCDLRRLLSRRPPPRPRSHSPTCPTPYISGICMHLFL